LPQESVSFEIKKLQILDENGKCDLSLLPKELDAAAIKKMYRWMVVSRIFDQKAFSLQRQGRILTYAPHIGQEATQIGCAAAMAPQDWLIPNYRSNAAMISRGMPMEMLFQYWAGDERGMRIPEKLNIFPLAITVGVHIPHAVGAGWAAKARGEKWVPLVFFGDGASSKGDFNEGLNMAGVLKVPCVFVCENNQWAISLPRSQQTAAKTIAQKAIAFGFGGVWVDGNDVFAVFKAAKEALEKARKGDGPTLIECETYRIGDHTTADDASRYRSAQEVETWRKRDPIARLEKYMMDNGMLTAAEKEKIWSEANAAVERAVKAAEAMPPPGPEDIFRFTYAEMPPHLKEQMSELSRSILEGDLAASAREAS